LTLVIETRALAKAFRGVPAVDGLELEVHEGEIYAFLGPNGAGKTTAIRLLLGLLRPDAGEARVLGLDPAKDPIPIRRRVGFLLEHDGLYERLSAHANLEHWARLHKIPRSESRRRIREVLEDMDLNERAHDGVHTFSRGMRRRLAVARAILPRPELLILDEPTIGLDPHAVVDLRRRLQLLANEDGTTVFLTTHNLPEAGKTAHRIGVISKGRLLEAGTEGELSRRHGASQVIITGARLGEDAARAVLEVPGVLGATPQSTEDTLRVRLERQIPLAPVLQRLIETGGEVEGTTRHDEDLEEIFLRLIRYNEPPAAATTPHNRQAQHPKRPLPPLEENPR
jgi:ABC-2 type transport system ATP-binding protein